MRTLTKLSLIGVLVAVSGCASPEPVVRQGRVYGSDDGYGRQSGYGYQRQADPLRKGATDANSIESIVSSAARIGRLLGGSSY